MWCAISSYFNDADHCKNVTVNQNIYQQWIIVPLLYDLQRFCCARNMLLKIQQSQQDDRTSCIAQHMLQLLQLHFTNLLLSRDCPFHANTLELTPPITHLQGITKARVPKPVPYDNWTKTSVRFCGIEQKTQFRDYLKIYWVRGNIKFDKGHLENVFAQFYVSVDRWTCKNAINKYIWHTLLWTILYTVEWEEEYERWNKLDVEGSGMAYFEVLPQVVWRTAENYKKQ